MRAVPLANPSPSLPGWVGGHPPASDLTRTPPPLPFPAPPALFLGTERFGRHRLGACSSALSRPQASLAADIRTGPLRSVGDS